ncbi:hypothetical protein ACFLXD_01830 [Chloroflexota bacterium]
MVNQTIGNGTEALRYMPRPMRQGAPPSRLQTQNSLIKSLDETEAIVKAFYGRA